MEGAQPGSLMSGTNPAYCYGNFLRRKVCLQKLPLLTLRQYKIIFKIKIQDCNDTEKLPYFTLYSLLPESSPTIKIHFYKIKESYDLIYDINISEEELTCP